MVKRHSRAHVRIQRERAVQKWRRYRRTFVDRPERRVQPGEWWTQEGRFNKLTLSCDCRMCSIERAERKFRSHKQQFYRALDRVDVDDATA
jgi:hypothetical protein